MGAGACFLRINLLELEEVPRLKLHDAIPPIPMSSSMSLGNFLPSVVRKTFRPNKYLERYCPKCSSCKVGKTRMCGKNTVWFSAPNFMKIRSAIHELLRVHNYTWQLSIMDANAPKMTVNGTDIATHIHSNQCYWLTTERLWYSAATYPSVRRMTTIQMAQEFVSIIWAVTRCQNSVAELPWSREKTTVGYFKVLSK